MKHESDIEKLTLNSHSIVLLCSIKLKSMGTLRPFVAVDETLILGRYNGILKNNGSVFWEKPVWCY
jgi:hypothetical protein